MDTRTGEIAPLQEFQERMTTAEQAQYIRVVDPSNLSPRARRLLDLTGRTQVSRNSRCPCGSGKRFKRCCMAKE